MAGVSLSWLHIDLSTCMTSLNRYEFVSAQWHRRAKTFVYFVTDAMWIKRSPCLRGLHIVAHAEALTLFTNVTQQLNIESISITRTNTHSPKYTYCVSLHWALLCVSHPRSSFGRSTASAAALQLVPSIARGRRAGGRVHHLRVMRVLLLVLLGLSEEVHAPVGIQKVHAALRLQRGRKGEEASRQAGRQSNGRADKWVGGQAGRQYAGGQVNTRHHRTPLTGSFTLNPKATADNHPRHRPTCPPLLRDQLFCTRPVNCTDRVHASCVAPTHGTQPATTSISLPPSL